MIMGTAEKQNISVQHREWNKNMKPQLMTCEEWRNRRFSQMAAAGAEILYNKQQDLFKIVWQGKAAIYVKQAEIRADYERCYLKKEVSA